MISFMFKFFISFTFSFFILAYPLGPKPLFYHIHVLTGPLTDPVYEKIHKTVVGTLRGLGILAKSSEPLKGLPVSLVQSPLPETGADSDERYLKSELQKLQKILNSSEH